jgi:hypothetical protein
VPPANAAGKRTDAELLVGKWLSSQGGGIEFKADSRVVLFTAAKSQEMRYRWGPGRTIEFLTAKGEVGRRWHVEALDDNVLVATGGAGASSFKRAP